LIQKLTRLQHLVGPLCYDLDVPDPSAFCSNAPESVGNLDASRRRSDVFIHAAATDMVSDSHNNSPIE
jgi:hypothetical protein